MNLQAGEVAKHVAAQRLAAPEIASLTHPGEHRAGGASIGQADEYLIFRYYVPMKSMTATEASRHFSDLLDAVERGETVTILRGNHPIAEIGPAHRRTGTDLRAALEGSSPPDEPFARNISAALAMVTSEVPDPWADA